MTDEGRQTGDEDGTIPGMRPKVTNSQMSWERRALKQVADRLTSQATFWTKVISGFANGMQIRFKAMTLIGTKLRQDALVRPRVSFFLRVNVRRVDAKQLVRGGCTPGR
jgi:hypothetical protein